MVRTPIFHLQLYSCHPSPLPTSTHPPIGTMDLDAIKANLNGIARRLHKLLNDAWDL